MQEIDTYVLVIAEILPVFLLGMYIAPLFRTTYRMVAEKETKMRESMRMMGMKDFPYWMSWFSYYTIVNTVLSLIVFLNLSLSKAITLSDPLILFLIPWLYG